MNQGDLLTRYNYDAFTPDNVLPWLNFANSPELGKPAPDFPLWQLAGTETSLGAVCKQNRLTVVEFGSFP